ncbi:hypothetical protein M3P05_13925 [Sansalvadorimonas sp. 2012CJ34-2]|uniref:Uncharacterized protein n=1 Tax=Parendozoicomonas callyspongiae TaxID=2942213 RepID=A0ABT0PI11_9GAMM|nr:hypothetical protein [Sansalvadorimonas sp. 2012CJ34-2]MCL6271025.1 hypothetical protein [Sansalvadorimonas sp. 2012CJ34-2]
MSDKKVDKSSSNKKSSSAKSNNVVDIFTRREVKDAEANKIIRIAPELDGLEMLYSNDANKDKMFSMKILCWALRQNGEVDAMVPWLTRLVPAKNLNDPLNGHWEGYYDSKHERLFYDPPVHKVVELEGAATYFKDDEPPPPKSVKEKEKPVAQVMQEIPDCIGTHVVMSSNAFQTITLNQVTSWRLNDDGAIQAMIADNEKIGNTPVLPGDECLYPAQEDNSFKYFFHHVIANKIKSGDPDAIEAFSKLIDK